jgi:nucleoside-diphosphate-sugar epimerase
MSKTALVTGASGFVGRHVTPLLREMGYAVAEIDVNHPTNPLKAEAFYDREYRSGFTKWDVILHFAANIEDINARVHGGVAIFQDICLDYETAKYIERNPPKEAVVWMTSCAVDWAKEDPYSWVKLTGEKYCEALVKKGVPVKILRPFSGYGHTQALSYPFPAILSRAKRKEDPLTVWGSGLQVRDWVHISDLAQACVHSIHHFPVGVPVPIGTGIGTDFLTLARMMADAVGYSPEIFADTTKAEASPRRVCESTLAMECGWEPKVTLEQGIAMGVQP